MDKDPITWIELMRASEHMRSRCMATFSDKVLSRAFYEAAQMLESEANRLRADGHAEAE